MASQYEEKRAGDAELQPNVKDNQAGEVGFEKGEVVTASGHVQELERNFVRIISTAIIYVVLIMSQSLINMCAVAIVIGNCWAITGATIVRTKTFNQEKMTDKTSATDTLYL